MAIILTLISYLNGLLNTYSIRLHRDNINIIINNLKINNMNNLTKKQSHEITNLYEMLSNGWHYTNHPMHYKFMQAHNELPDYKG